MGEFTVGYSTYYGYISNAANKIKYDSFTMPNKGIPLRGYIKTYLANGAKFKVAIYNASNQLLAESDEGTVTGDGIVTSGPAYFTGQPAIDPQTIKLAQNMDLGRYGIGPAGGGHQWYNYAYSSWPSTLSTGSTISAPLVVWVVFDEVFDDSADLVASFYVMDRGSEDLPAQFEVGQGSEDLPAQFEVGQGSEDLHGEFVVKQWQEDLPGEFVARHSGLVELHAIFEGQVSLDMPGEFIVRQDDSVELPASFDGQVSLNLLGEFDVRQEVSVNLFGQLIIRHEASVDLHSGFIIRHADTTSLSAEFVVRPSDTRSLAAEFVVRQKTTADLLADFIVRHVGTPVNLLGAFVVQYVGVPVELLGEFDIRRTSTEGLLGAFDVRQETSAELLGEFIVQHEASVELLVEFDVRASSSVNLLAGFSTRYNAGSVNLIVGFEVGQGWENLPAFFVASRKAPRELFAEFVVRHPYPFWTDRELLNGVVHLDEVVIGDAALEEIIGGVMNDVRTWLLANEIAAYSQWRNIDGTPLAIRRATTYGTVASMYARRIFSPHDVAVRVAPMDFKVITTHESAMEYWEEKMDEALENYLTSIGKMRIWVSTEDEDPEFTMDDVEEFSIPE